MNNLFFILALMLAQLVHAKELALSFDDSPMPSSKHFETNQRTDELIRKLKNLKVPTVMVFANPCKQKDSLEVLSQLKRYLDSGHLIANHTCSHPRLDDVGFNAYSADVLHGDRLLSSLFNGQRYFRFPYLNEGSEEKLRDEMRKWLRVNQYRNGMVSIDNDDYIFSFKINQAKNIGNKIDYKKVEKLFVEHVVGAANFYDELAIKTLGYSPKHVLLLHEMDATVLFLDGLVKGLREDGWKIIGIPDAYKDKLYLERPKNTYANNGIIAQLSMEKTGVKIGYKHFDLIKDELDKILGLEIKNK